MGRQWRHQPIACQSCRRRKIRCSRKFPCSNCTSRGISCLQFYAPESHAEHSPVTGPGPGPLALPELPQQQQQQQQQQQPRRQDHNHDAKAHQQRRASEQDSPPLPGADIQARLARLEQCVSLLGVSEQPRGEARVACVPSPNDGEPSAAPALPSAVQHLSEDALQLGSRCIHLNPSTRSSQASLFSDVGVVYHLSPIRAIRKPCCILQDAGWAGGGGSPQICFVLPFYHEACLILQTFVADCATSCFRAPVPSLLLSIQGIYASIQQQIRVNTEDLLLLMAMTAAVTYVCSADDSVCTLYSNHSEANAHCSTWVEAGFALSDELKRGGQTGIVCLQGHRVLLMVSCYLEGMSLRNRSLLTTSIAMARAMGLHRVDLPGQDHTLRPAMDLETARRIWWDLVVIDWLLSVFPGSHEQVYTIQPNHMAVNKPSVVGVVHEIDAKQAASPTTPFQLQQYQELATDVAYFRARIHLAELAREYTDSSPISAARTKNDTYQHLLDYEAKLDAYQESLPQVFQPCARSNYAPRPKTQQLVLQRTQLNCVIYITKCILHLQYMALHNADPRYAPSRKTCSDCARDIIRMHRNYRTHCPWIIPKLKTTTFLRALILANAVFLLDLCSGPATASLEKDRPDGLEGWKLLGLMWGDSNLVDQFLEFATHMLAKYGVCPSTMAELTEALPAEVRWRHLANGSAYESPAAVPPPGEAGLLLPVAAPTETDQKWQMLGADFDPRTISWDNVLWGFDAFM